MSNIRTNSSNCFIPTATDRNNPNIQYSIAMLGEFDMPNVSDVCEFGVRYDDQLEFEEYVNSIVGRGYY